MKEQLITFETALLSKENGFIHVEANCFGDNMCYQLPEGELINAIKGNTVSGYILAPTQSLLQKWLRESFEIIVSVLPYSTTSKSGRFPSFIWMIHGETASTLTHDPFSTYEEALEKGLITALKYLNNTKKE